MYSTDDPSLVMKCRSLADADLLDHECCWVVLGITLYMSAYDRTELYEQSVMQGLTIDRADMTIRALWGAMEERGLFPVQGPDRQATTADQRRDYFMILRAARSCAVHFGGRRVPKHLLSGHHKKINEWRREAAAKTTREQRPDLWALNRDCNMAVKD